MKDSINKLELLTKLETEINIRSIALSMICNLINAYLEVHPVTKEEQEAIQKAFSQEDAYIKQLISVFNGHLSLADHNSNQDQAKTKKTKTSAAKKSTKSEDE